MTLKAYYILSNVMLSVLGLSLIGLGLLIRQPGFEDLEGWTVVFGGTVLLLGGLISYFIAARLPTEMLCPRCGKKIVPKVKWASGRLYLSRKEE